MFPTIVGAWVLDGGVRGEDSSAILSWTEPRLCCCECGRARGLRRLETGIETAMVAGAQAGDDIDGERYLEGWKMSQSRMTTRLRS